MSWASVSVSINKQPQSLSGAGPSQHSTLSRILSPLAWRIDAMHLKSITIPLVAASFWRV
jgi:hypothetical protein